MRSDRLFRFGSLFLWSAMVLGGCAWWEGRTVRSQSPDDADAGLPNVRLVGDLAAPAGMCMLPLRVEATGLVTGLHGTGSDPPPSRYRQMLLGQMQARDIEAPNTVLASSDNALVVVQAMLRPGIQKGDRFDVEVLVPPRSETTSLSGGWLLPLELKEYAFLHDRRLHSGNAWGQAVGPIMVDPSADPKQDRVSLRRGRILGGGTARKSRPLGLVLKPESRSKLHSPWIEAAINKRFYSSYKGIKTGMAKAKTDRFIELTVHPRYKDNIERYVRVVRAIPIREGELQRQQRLGLLEKQLLDPITSSRAALQLEAIGQEGVDVLRKGIQSPDPEVRFHSAEALAYLDQSEAAEPLAEAARQQRAFRVFALSALSAMNDLAAEDELLRLLNGDSVETRYGAFRALSAMNRNNPVVMGEQLGGQFSYHVLDTSGTPMIHVTRSRRPEIVLFGQDQRLQTPFVVDAGHEIMVVGTEPDQVAVSKFAVEEMPQRRIVSNRVDEVIRAIVNLGGTYPDVVQALQASKQKEALSSRLEVDALPEAGRVYDRVADNGPRRGDSEDSADSDDSGSKRLGAGKLVPKLFGNRSGSGPRSGGAADQTSGNLGEKGQDRPEESPVKTFFARMTGGGSR